MYESDDEQSKKEFYYYESKKNKNNNIENDDFISRCIRIYVMYVVIYNNTLLINLHRRKYNTSPSGTRSLLSILRSDIFP